MRILFATDFTPSPCAPHAGGKLLFHYAEGLRKRGWEVAFLCPVRDYEQPLLNTLGDFLVFAAPVRPDALRRARRLWLSVQHPLPYAFVRSIGLAAEAKRALDTFRPDVVHATQPHVVEAIVSNILHLTKRPVLVAHAIDVVAKLHIRALLRRDRLPFQHWQQIREALIAIPRELRLYSQSDLVLCHSTSDKTFLRAFLPNHIPVKVLPAWFDARENILPCITARALTQSENDLLYVGNPSDPRTREALDWLLTEIYPIIRHHRPQTTLLISGITESADRMRWCFAPEIRCPGFVEDVVSLYDQSRLLIAPLRMGGGIHIKVLNAFARGCPVIMTSIANDGIGARNDMEACIADDAAGLARAALRLLENPEQGYVLAKRALQWIKRYSSSDIQKLEGYLFHAAGLQNAQYAF